MGIEFRTGRYLRRVRIGKRTIKEGEAAVIWDNRGRCKEIVGPALKRMWYSTIRFLDVHIAKPGQYIVIQRKDGVIEHLIGPATVFENPVKHIGVKVLDGHELATAQDCLVVATRRAQSVVTKSLDTAGVPDDFLDRRVVRGPMQFVPQVNETVQQMKWLDWVDQTLGERGTSKVRTFSVIDTRPFRINVRTGLTTAEGLTYIVRLNIGARIVDVDTAIDTADPIGAMWQALLADFARIGASMSSDGINGAELGAMQLSALRNTATAVGIAIVDVQVQGMQRPANLQNEIEAAKAAEQAHTDAIRAAERAAEIESRNAQGRLRRVKQDEEIACAEFKAAQLAEKHDFEIKKMKQEHDMKLEANAHKTTVDSTREKNDIMVDFLGKLRQFDVDLTKYLTSMPPADAATDPRAKVAQQAGLDPNSVAAAACAGVAAASQYATAPQPPPRPTMRNIQAY